MPEPRIALVVGVDEYPSAPLEGSVNDAKAVAGVLKNHGDGRPNFEVKLCVSPQKGITKGYLRTQIKQLFASDSSVALLYFAGHGLIDSTGGYIVAVDGTREDPGISMDEILVLANKGKQNNRVVILDCCHSGAFGSPAPSAVRP